MAKIPLNKADNYSAEIITARQKFLQEQTNVAFQHITNYSFDPTILRGNLENFIGVAQVPVGLAGPIKVNGEYAQGEFYIPMATTEGSLVASYSRGMKLLSQAGGVTCTVLDDAMQRAPLFVFENARLSRKFGQWVDDNFENIKLKAEETTQSGKLTDIEQYTVGKLHWLRFNFTTGDAAGQNMVTKATHRACHWMLEQGIEGLEHFSMAANMDTDKKHSHLNTLQSRGKRVVAEATITNELLQEIMHTSAEALFKQRQLSNVGAILSNSSNNGAHSANGLTAMFIATGQDVANIAESSAAITHSEIKPNGDYYISITIPSLIIATYGGGTALPTQQECLEILGCFGAGKVYKLAEIMAAVVLAGELSLASAIVANEWVSSHEALGRNR
ncbi:hydroxymethylglutaryl-CoA reductase [Emticicia aquatilis]|uniref:hydroxymethylglutaryl-CoA reductase (NADPH) n=1 Tax=Emticicia aquatilis TaxID=1537369 RepID=A0A916YRR3_9BACT|nr:hydroxymethylglutaryl-CoA reductase [Emticicia aquatilis]GGD58462.1 hydroxymethylglutaryl-CoA reductase [Emticicia aquatilis]